MTLSMMTWVNSGVARPTSWMARLASSTSRQMRLWRSSSGTNQEKPKGFFWASGGSVLLTDSETGGSACTTSSRTGAAWARAASSATVSGADWPGLTQARVSSPCWMISAGVRVVRDGGWDEVALASSPEFLGVASGAGVVSNATAGSGKADNPASGQCSSPASRPSASRASINVGRSIGGGNRWITSSASNGRRWKPAKLPKSHSASCACRHPCESATAP